MTISPNTTSFQRPDLGMSYDAFDLEAERLGFIATKVLPMFMAGQKQANFTFHRIEELKKDIKTDRAPGAEYQQDDLSFGQASYNCKEFGSEADLDDGERLVYRYSFDAEKVVSDRAINIVWRDLERKVASAVFNSTTWTGSALTTGVSVPWTTSATCTPITDIHNALKKVRNSCGDKANAVIMSYDNFLNCQVAAQIVNRLIYTAREESKKISTQQLADLFQVDMVLVGDGMRNTANEGAALSLANIWGNSFVMVAKLAKTNDLKEPCLGRLFHFELDGNGSVIVEQYRKETKRSDCFRARTNYDPLILDARCGHLLTGVSS